jgi:hypothetical protein
MCLHQINNHVNHGIALNKPIWWKFVCSNGCHMVSRTHVLFQELFRPFACDNKPSIFRFNEIKRNGL